MATAKKHKERSHRNYHTAKPFADFERKANYKKGQKQQRKPFLETLKSMFHRTTNK